MAISTITNNSVDAAAAIATSKLGTGAVLQVIQASISTTVQTTSTSFVATGLIASITPKFSTSKILVTLNGGTTTYDTGALMVTQIFRQIASGSYAGIGGNENMSVQGVAYGYSHSLSWLDSPATTSVVNYQPYYKGNSATGVYFNYAPTGGIPTLTLMEIAG
jgi:hypothetical protein